MLSSLNRLGTRLNGRMASRVNRLAVYSILGNPSIIAAVVAKIVIQQLFAITYRKKDTVLPLGSSTVVSLLCLGTNSLSRVWELQSLLKVKVKKFGGHFFCRLLTVSMPCSLPAPTPLEKSTGSTHQNWCQLRGAGETSPSILLLLSQIVPSQCV